MKENMDIDLQNMDITDVEVSAVDFFRLIDHRLNRSLKINFFQFLELSVTFDRSGNDQKIHLFYPTT